MSKSDELVRHMQLILKQHNIYIPKPPHNLFFTVWTTGLDHRKDGSMSTVEYLHQWQHGIQSGIGLGNDS